MMRRRRAPSDSGVIAIVGALVIAMGLMVGMLAMTVDVGRLFVERRDVQNGADAAALALADDCARGRATCVAGTASITRASAFANANAKDGTTQVSAVCGASPLAACTTPSAHAWECQSPASYPRYVRVRTATREQDGTSVVPPVFSDVMNGRPGTGLWACAQAAWGAARSAGTVVPFAISICDYAANGTLVAVSFANNGSTRTCTIRDNDGITRTYTSALTGLTYFTKDGASFDCVTPVMVSIGDLLTRQNVASTQQVCGVQPGPRLNALLGQTLYLPIVGDVQTNGQGSYPFQVIAFAAVVFRGYFLQNAQTSGGTPPPPSWGANGCRSGVSCLYGQFTTGVTTGDLSTGGPNTGVTVIQLIP